MNKDESEHQPWTLSKKSFEALLSLLDPDTEVAARKYEEIRSGLVRVLSYRGCVEAEDVADEIIDRVARRAPELSQVYKGDPARYFYGVLKNVHREYVKRKHPHAPDPIPKDPEREVVLTCLDGCLESLDEPNRTLVLEYYRESGMNRVLRRRWMARSLGISSTALRIRAHRIRSGLRDCVLSCMKGKRHDT